MENQAITLSEKEAVGIQTALAIVDCLAAGRYPDVIHLMNGIHNSWGHLYWKAFRQRFIGWVDDHYPALERGEKQPSWWKDSPGEID